MYPFSTTSIALLRQRLQSSQTTVSKAAAPQSSASGRTCRAQSCNPSSPPGSLVPGPPQCARAAKRSSPAYGPAFAFIFACSSNHFNLRQVVPQSRLKIIRIVRRRHLHRARPKLRLRQLIRNNRNLPLHQRQHHILPMQMRYTLVLRIHRNRRIAQHRLRPRRRTVINPSPPTTGYRIS
jgi:hypothetical protein